MGNVPSAGKTLGKVAVRPFLERERERDVLVWRMRAHWQRGYRQPVFRRCGLGLRQLAIGQGLGRNVRCAKALLRGLRAGFCVRACVRTIRTHEFMSRWTEGKENIRTLSNHDALREPRR